MRAWVHAQVQDTGSPEQRLERLLGAIVSPSGLGLSYEAGHTNTAREAFVTRGVKLIPMFTGFLALAALLALLALTWWREGR